MASDDRSPDERAKHVWSIGSYTDIAPSFLGMAAHLVDRVDVGADDTVLDVGCGTGNVAITAARRGASVTGVDLVPAMLEEARRSAAIADAEDVAWGQGSATDLPFEDDAFDVTLSSVAHVFAEPPDTAGRELCRVTRSGGRIGFTSWTPTSVVAAMGGVLRDYVPPDPDATEPPYLWGDPDVVRERLDDGVADLAFETETIRVPVLSPAHYWEKAITESGPFIVALEAVDEADRPALRREAIETIGEFFDDRGNAVRMTYRLVTATVD